MTVRINGNAGNRAAAASKRGRIGEGGSAVEKSLKRPILKGRKYRNKKVTIDGITFDSKRESERYQELKALASRNLIEDLRHQVPFELAPGVRFSDEKRAKPALRYVADFAYQLDGRLVVEDVKSAITAKAAAYRIKRHLMLAVHGIEVQEVR
ncbi:DUF1064 domain-containing protein [Aquabacterium sp.]|uniref:DUF1064 domain-containing protein n=1 Tax=Aquabacterium sp. TaxID=1872578 RepID=UPI0026204DF7|nr:DUF1064 domain-containing protein [Aquabacterium sp.]MDD2978302.1 DUF1064 domain-containing protein [Aquabacterium sp.]